MFLRIHVLLLVLSCLLSCGESEPQWPADAGPERPLVVVLQKAEGQTAAQVEAAYAVHLKLLARKTGCEIRPVAVGTPSEAMLLLSNGQADIGWLPPLLAATLLREERTSILALCVEEKAPAGLEAVSLLVPEGFGDRPLTDLRDRKIAVASVVDAVEPFVALAEEGAQDLVERVDFLRVSDDTPAIVALAEGDVAAALLKASTHRRVVEDGLYTTTRFQALRTVDCPVADALVSSPRLPEGLRRVVQGAVIGFASHENGPEREAATVDSAGRKVHAFLTAQSSVKAYEQALDRLLLAVRLRADAMSIGTVGG